jgi:hypothetical protein
VRSAETWTTGPRIGGVPGAKSCAMGACTTTACFAGACAAIDCSADGTTAATAGPWVVSGNEATGPAAPAGAGAGVWVASMPIAGSCPAEAGAGDVPESVRIVATLEGCPVEIAEAGAATVSAAFPGTTTSPAAGVPGSPSGDGEFTETQTKRWTIGASAASPNLAGSARVGAVPVAAAAGRDATGCPDPAAAPTTAGRDNARAKVSATAMSSLGGRDATIP